jgi:hypothetical protein
VPPLFRSGARRLGACGEITAVRNRALHDQLHQFAESASHLLSAAVDAGAEIPYEVAESPGARSVLYRYRPLSAEFVRERFTELKAMPGFGVAAAALARVEGVSGYLRVMGASYVPAAERDRAEAAIECFLGRVWEDSTAFELDLPRFERAYRELESIVYEDTALNTVLAPVIGVAIAGERWELGAGVTLARGDLVDAPPEAVWGSGRTGEDPHTLVILTAQSEPSEPPPLTEARVAFKRLITALRLLKSGAAVLGSNAWWRTDDGPWQTAPLGSAGRVRGARYWLEEPERAELAELFELARARHAHGGALPWALARFELGCEQRVALEGLSDHLLAVRALLDRGESTAGEMARRLGALCAEPAHRDAVQETVEQAFRLERLVMRGDVDAAYLQAIGVTSPDAVVSALEDHLRALLRDMVCGHLSLDLTGIADELLSNPPAREGEIKAAARRPRTPVSPPVPEFVVRRGETEEEEPAELEAAAEAEAPHFEEPDPDDEDQDTGEAVAVGGVREVRGEDPGADFDLDDDAADYSAAV